MENPNDKINIAVWDEGTADTPQGMCVRGLPLDPAYDQRMITEWIPLASADGKPGRGKIRVGIQYIFDQVRLVDTVIRKREEEYKAFSEDMQNTQEILNQTSTPFEILINPNYTVPVAKRPFSTETMLAEKGPNPLTAAFGKVKNAVSDKVGAAETYISTTVRDFRPPGMKWTQVAQIAGITYAILACLAAFAKEDFINVGFLCCTGAKKKSSKRLHSWHCLQCCVILHFYRIQSLNLKSRVYAIF